MFIVSTHIFIICEVSYSIKWLYSRILQKAAATCQNQRIFLFCFISVDTCTYSPCHTISNPAQAHNCDMLWVGPLPMENLDFMSEMT